MSNIDSPHPTTSIKAPQLDHGTFSSFTPSKSLPKVNAISKVPTSPSATTNAKVATPSAPQPTGANDASDKATVSTPAPNFANAASDKATVSTPAPNFANNASDKATVSTPAPNFATPARPAAPSATPISSSAMPAQPHAAQLGPNTRAVPANLNTTECDPAYLSAIQHALDECEGSDKTMQLDLENAPKHAPVQPQQEEDDLANIKTVSFESPFVETKQPQPQPQRVQASDTEWDPNLPQIGDIIHTYKVTGLLGVGGFGAVFDVSNIELERDEALKLLLPDPNVSAELGIKRFLREINVIARLEHPNVVRLYNAGILPNGAMWMTMQKIDGERLDHLLCNEGALPFAKAKRMMSQILCALAEAHEREIIHRDLKPSNIIITQKLGYPDLVKLLDFGLAKALGKDENQDIQSLTQNSSSVVFGSPQYMSPEQLKKGIMGPASDIYAAGLIMLELLTGTPAFTGATPIEVATKQFYITPELPRNWDGKAIRAFILKAIAKDATQRYPSAREMFEALQRIRSIDDDESVLTNPTTSDDNPTPQPEERVPLRPATPETLPQLQNTPQLPLPPIVMVICTFAFIALLILLLILVMTKTLVLA